MSGPNLPVNVDATYADDPSDASKKLHQEHHDAIHQRVNILDKDTAPNDGDFYIYSAASGTFKPTPFSTTGSAPGNATYVTMVSEAGLSAESVLGSAVIMSGVVGSLPAFGTAGRLYYETDTGLLVRDTGAAWSVIGVGSGYGQPSDVQSVAVSALAGSSLLISRADHVHPHGSGYLTDAHHSQIHSSSDHSDSYASALSGVRMLTGPVSYPVANGDGIIICDATAGAITITLPGITPTASPPAAGSVGVSYVFVRKDTTSNDVKLVASGSDTIQTDAHLSGVNQRVGIFADTTGGSPYAWRPLLSHRGAELVVKSTDTTRSNTASVTDDDQLVVHVTAGQAYAFKVQLFYEGTNTADFQVTLSAPATSTGGWSPTGVTSNQAFNQATGTSGTMVGFGTAKSFGAGGASNYDMVSIEGIVVAGADGLLTVQWAQAVAEVSNTILHKGSTISYARV